MEGKETRYGLAETGVFAVGTTNTSTGAVISSHDSMTPLGGAVPLVDIFMGEITPGGVGVGMNGMLLLHHPGGVHRRSDGRPHPRIPGKEDRGQTDQAGPDRNGIRSDRRACHDRDRGRNTRGLDIDVQRQRRTASVRRCTPTRHRAITTAAPSPATPAARDTTWPTTWAVRHDPGTVCPDHHHAACGRFAGGQAACIPQGRARCVTTRRCSE